MHSFTHHQPRLSLALARICAQSHVKSERIFLWTSFGFDSQENICCAFRIYWGVRLARNYKLVTISSYLEILRPRRWTFILLLAVSMWLIPDAFAASIHTILNYPEAIYSHIPHVLAPGHDRWVRLWQRRPHSRGRRLCPELIPLSLSLHHGDPSLNFTIKIAIMSNSSLVSPPWSSNVNSSILAHAPRFSQADFIAIMKQTELYWVLTVRK